MMKAQMDVNQEEMTASQEIKASLHKLKATVRASQEKTEKMRADLTQIKASAKVSQEKMEAAINSIWSELKDTITIRVEDALSSVDQWAHCLHKELNMYPSN
jgi:predicted nuclease with TOPRIM domain